MRQCLGLMPNTRHTGAADSRSRFWSESMGRPPPPELPHNPIEKDGSGCNFSKQREKNKKKLKKQCEKKLFFHTGIIF